MASDNLELVPVGYYTLCIVVRNLPEHFLHSCPYFDLGLIAVNHLRKYLCLVVELYYRKVVGGFKLKALRPHKNLCERIYFSREWHLPFNKLPLAPAYRANRPRREIIGRAGLAEIAVQPVSLIEFSPMNRN